MGKTLNDVKDYLVMALGELADGDKEGDELARTVERAKVISQVAGTYISAVKTEIDALRLADEIGMLPRSVEPGDNVRQMVGGARPRLVGNG